MGGGQTTPIGALAKDITSSDDQLCLEYIEKLNFVKSQIGHLSPEEKMLTILQFNESYMYGVDVREVGKGSTALLYHADDKLVDSIETYKFAYLKRVLSLCLRSDLCAKLGMSLMEFMSLEYPIFEYIEKTFIETKPTEMEHMEELTKDLEKSINKSKNK